MRQALRVGSRAVTLPLPVMFLLPALLIGGASAKLQCGRTNFLGKDGVWDVSDFSSFLTVKCFSKAGSPNLTKSSAPCAACKGHDDALCQVAPATATSPRVEEILGGCVGSSKDGGTQYKCVGCLSHTDKASCDVRARGSTDQRCTWIDEVNEGEAHCRLADTPCLCDGPDPSDGCVGKGWAPPDMFCNKCNFAQLCNLMEPWNPNPWIPNPWNDYETNCVSNGCTWTPDSAAGPRNGTCSACACSCDGCATDEKTLAFPRGTCSFGEFTQAECLANKSTTGEWCQCNDVLPCSAATGEAVCTKGRAKPTRGATTKGACLWARFATEYVGCSECVVDADCVSGFCSGSHNDEPIDFHFTCTGCSSKEYCNGRGTATHGGPGVCTCTCDDGFAGEQCNIALCPGKGGDVSCDACTAIGIEMGGFFTHYTHCRSIGEGTASYCTYRNVTTWPHPNVTSCGFRSGLCQPADVPSCGPHGVVSGKIVDLCYCSCEEGYFGPSCTQKTSSKVKPPSVTCAATAGTNTSDTFEVIVTNNNDRAVDIRVCDSQKCTGTTDPYRPCSTTINVSVPNPGRFPAGPCVDTRFTGYMPARQTVSVRLPLDTTYIIAVDRKCGNNAAEFYAPKGGKWPSSIAWNIATMCTALEWPNDETTDSCEHFDGCSASHPWNCTKATDEVGGWCSFVDKMFPGASDESSICTVNVPCNATACCSS